MSAPSPSSGPSPRDIITPSALSTGPTPTRVSSASASPSPPPSSLQPGSSLTGGLSPALIAGLISAAAFFVAVFALCAWSRRARAWPDSVLRRHNLPTLFGPRRRGGGDEQWGEGEYEGAGLWGSDRGRRRAWGRLGREGRMSGESGKAKPVMFDAWIERRQRRPADVVTWEAESVPISATLFTRTTAGAAAAAAAVEPACTAGAEVASGTGGTSVEEEDEKPPLREGTAGTDGSGSTLQVAVLLQMPSPRHHPEAQNDAPEELLGELAIGLIGVPWTTEDPYSRERTIS